MCEISKNTLSSAPGYYGQVKVGSTANEKRMGVAYQKARASTSNLPSPFTGEEKANANTPAIAASAERPMVMSSSGDAQEQLQFAVMIATVFCVGNGCQCLGISDGCMARTKDEPLRG